MNLVIFSLKFLAFTLYFNLYGDTGASHSLCILNHIDFSDESIVLVNYGICFYFLFCGLFLLSKIENTKKCVNFTK